MRTTFSPTGEIHEEVGNELFKEISTLLEHNDVILDVSSVTFISSKPFGQIAALSRLAKEAGTDFRIQGATPHPMPYRVFAPT